MSVSLSEQMGAMSLVDQLRHRDMAIQEHLDLPRRRAEVAERIRTYYQSNGIEYDDASIEEGVRQFFSRRLKFEAPALPLAQRLLVRAAMGRHRLLSGLRVALLAGLVTMGWNWVKNVEAGEAADQFERDSHYLIGERATQRQRLEQVNLRLKQQPNPTAAQLVSNIQHLLSSPELPLDIQRPDPITLFNRNGLEERIARAQDVLSGARNNLANARQQLQRVDGVFASPKQQHQHQVITQMVTVNLPADQRQQVMVWTSQAEQVITSLNLEQGDNTLAAADDYMAYAAQPLTLELIDRPGIESGIERCYEAAGCKRNSTSGKSWYLIVQALNAAGNPVLVPVTSVEDGNTRWVRQFGVRVSHAEYLKVRQDKLDDGHISQRGMGDKPANSLVMRFNQRTSPTPDMISQW